MEEIDDLIIKRKVFISTVGWISSILSGLIVYFSIFGIINIIVFRQNPMFKDFPINENPEIAHGFFKTFTMLFLIYGLSIILGIFFVSSSIGLIKYKDWARRIFTITSWVLIILSSVAVIIYIVYSGEIISIMIQGNIPIHGFDDMTGYMKTIIGLEIVSYGILLVVLIRALYRINRRFRMDDFKRLFN